jgi:hypothetical protein
MSIENEELAEIFRRYTAANNSLDTELVAKLDFGAAGFGFRTKAWRGAGFGGNVKTYAETLKKLLDVMEYDRVEPEGLNTSAEGDIGLIWGFYEKFKVKGRPPEQIHGRFSFLYRKEADG